MYTIDSENLSYMKLADDNKWYLSETSIMSNEEYEELKNELGSIKILYTYKEQVTYQNQPCYVIEAKIDPSSMTEEELEEYSSIFESTRLYINSENYTLAGTANDVLEIHYSYPESVTIPPEVIKTARLTPESYIKVNDITYKVTQNSTLTVTSAKKKLKNVTIPDKIKYRGKNYKVTSITYDAFLGHKKLQKIKLGKNIKRIGAHAFFNCKNLKKVTIQSKKVKKIGKNAFTGTSQKIRIKVAKTKVKKYTKLITNAHKQSKLKSFTKNEKSIPPKIPHT